MARTFTPDYPTGRQAPTGAHAPPHPRAATAREVVKLDHNHHRRRTRMQRGTSPPMKAHPPTQRSGAKVQATQGSGPGGTPSIHTLHAYTSVPRHAHMHTDLRKAFQLLSNLHHLSGLRDRRQVDKRPGFYIKGHIYTTRHPASRTTEDISNRNAIHHTQNQMTRRTNTSQK